MVQFGNGGLLIVPKILFICYRNYPQWQSYHFSVFADVKTTVSASTIYIAPIIKVIFPNSTCIGILFKYTIKTMPANFGANT